MSFGYASLAPQTTRACFVVGLPRGPAVCSIMAHRLKKKSKKLSFFNATAHGKTGADIILGERLVICLGRVDPPWRRGIRVDPLPVEPIGDAKR